MVRRRLLDQNKSGVLWGQSLNLSKPTFGTSVFPQLCCLHTHLSLGLRCSLYKALLDRSLTALASPTTWGFHHNPGFTFIDSQGLLLRTSTMTYIVWTQCFSDTAEEDSESFIFLISKQQNADDIANSSAASMRWTLPHLNHIYTSFSQSLFLLLCFCPACFSKCKFPPKN